MHLQPSALGPPPGLCAEPSAVLFDCVAKHSSNITTKFAEGPLAAGRTLNCDEAAYLEEVAGLTQWCRANPLSLDKNKKLLVDCARKRRRFYTTMTLGGAPEERVSGLKPRTEDLKWTTHIDTVTAKSRQRL